MAVGDAVDRDTRLRRVHERVVGIFPVRIPRQRPPTGGGTVFGGSTDAVALYFKDRGFEDGFFWYASALILVSLTTWWPYGVIGALIFIPTTIRWIKDTRRDIEALPLEHH